MRTPLDFRLWYSHFNFLACMGCGRRRDLTWVMLDGKISMEWSRRSRPPLLKCNWLCSDHFHHSQWVIRHVSDESTIITVEESSITWSLDDKLRFKAHAWKMHQERIQHTLEITLSSLCSHCWYITVCLRTRENNVIQRRGKDERLRFKYMTK